MTRRAVVQPPPALLRENFMGYLMVGVASLIGVVFAASAASKLLDYGGFRGSLPQLAPVRPELLGPLAVSVIAAEAAVPVLLSIPPTMASGFGLSAALLAAFSLAIAIALRHGRRVPCRCFGSSRTPLGASHLARNTILLILALAGGLATGGHVPPAGVAVAAVAGALAAIPVLALDDITYLFARSSSWPISSPPLSCSDCSAW
jgi:hypothetical protein